MYAAEFNPRYTNKLPKVSMVYPEPSPAVLNKPKLSSATSVDQVGTRSVFTKHYKDINFDTLKERHDNFSFEKVLETKNQLHDTMFFNNQPNNPNLILFMKQAQRTPQAIYDA